MTELSSPTGYRRVHGELAALCIKVAASTVWSILKEHGIPPEPEPAHTTGANFLRSQAEAALVPRRNLQVVRPVYRLDDVTEPAHSSHSMRALLMPTSPLRCPAAALWGTTASRRSPPGCETGSTTA
jgi:hypothetical protein